MNLFEDFSLTYQLTFINIFSGFCTHFEFQNPFFLEPLNEKQIHFSIR